MSWLPDRKVWAGGLAGFAAWLLVLAATRYGVPLDLQTASILVAAVGGGVSYLVPPSTRDIITRLNDGLVKMAQDDPSIPVSAPKVATQVTGAGVGKLL